MTTLSRSWVLIGCLLLGATALANPETAQPDSPNDSATPSVAQPSEDNADWVKLASLLDPWKENEPIGVGDWVLIRAIRENEQNIVIELKSKKDKPLKIRLSKRDDDKRRLCFTNSYNVADSSPASMEGQTTSRQLKALKAVCNQLNKNDQGQLALQAKPRNDPFSNATIPTQIPPFWLLGFFVFSFFLFYGALKKPEGFLARWGDWNRRHARHFLYLSVGLVITACIIVWITTLNQPLVETQSADGSPGSDSGLFGGDPRRPPLVDLFFILVETLPASTLITRGCHLLFWLGAALLFFRMMKTRFGEARASLATLPLLFSGPLLIHGSMQDHLALTLFLGLWSLALFLAYLEEQTQKRLVALGLLNMVFAWASFAGLIACIAQLCLVWIHPIDKKKGVIGVASLAIPFSILFLAGGGVSPIPTAFVSILDKAPLDTLLGFFFPTDILLWPAIFLTIVGAIRWKKSGEHLKLFSLFAAWIVLSLMLSEVLFKIEFQWSIVLLPIVSMTYTLGGTGASSTDLLSPWKEAALRALLAVVIVGTLFAFSAASITSARDIQGSGDIMQSE